VRLELGGWVLAGQLHTGDRLRTIRGTQVQVVELRYHVGRAAVYTLTVAKDHTFFVGSARVLVHNSNCPSIWTATHQRSAMQNAFQHWTAHRADFPQLHNAKQYVEFAHRFLNSPPATALRRVRANGDVVVFDPVTDIFGVRTSSGVPRTLFKPNPAIHGYSTNLDYFLAQ